MPVLSPQTCAQCRYDLRGAARAEPRQDRCPECGQTLTPAALAAVRERRFLWRLVAVVAGVGIAGLTIAGAAAALLPDRAVIFVPLFGVIMALGAVPVLAAAFGERAMSDR